MKPEKLHEWMKQNEIEENHLKLYHTEVGIQSVYCLNPTRKCYNDNATVDFSLA